MGVNLTSIIMKIPNRALLVLALLTSGASSLCGAVELAIPISLNNAVARSAARFVATSPADVAQLDAWLAAKGVGEGAFREEVRAHVAAMQVAGGAAGYIGIVARLLTATFTTQ